jgi:hypothetical protein
MSFYKGVGIKTLATRVSPPSSAAGTYLLGRRGFARFVSRPKAVLTSELIRAARALLRWEQRDLEAASP